MSLVVHLPAELEARLKRAAREQGLAEEEFVLRTLQHRLLDDRRHDALEMLRDWREQNGAVDAAELDERRRSWEAFKAGLNEHHSSARKVFP